MTRALSGSDTYGSGNDALAAKGFKRIAHVVIVLALAKQGTLNVVRIGLIPPGALGDRPREVPFALGKLLILPERAGKLPQHREDALTQFTDLSGYLSMLSRQPLKVAALGLALERLDALLKFLDLALASLDLDRVVLDGPLELQERIRVKARMAALSLNKRELPLELGVAPFEVDQSHFELSLG